VVEDVKVLSLGDMLFRRGGTLVRRLIQAWISVALRLFFRRIETANARVVPQAGPLVFVINHPNGLIDPGLVFTALPRRISFLAKSTLFRLPVVGALLGAVEALPLYRRVDEGEDMNRNRRTFEACRRLLRRGRCIALFPEGMSHNEPRLMPVKTGAARIALGARAVEDDDDDEGAAVSVDESDAGGDASAVDEEGAASPSSRGFDLKIVPVGLYYTSKTSFRSEALLRFGAPLEVPRVVLDEQGEPPREAVKLLSARIEEALRGVTLNAEDEEQLDVATKAERLFSSLYEGLNVELPLASKFDFLRRFVEARLVGGASGSGRADTLSGRILGYAEELRRIGIAPENLSLSRHSRWYVFRHFLLRAGLLAALLPLTVVGAVVHLPAYLLSALAARLYTKHGVDEVAPTVKILAAIVLMPLTWLIVGAVAFFAWGWRAAVLALPLSILCGYAAMRSLEEAYDMRGWYKAVVLLFRRRQLFLRLLLEREALRGEITRFEKRAGG
jgi:glycerol-3-phosphate O-acyltransferase / dihydroxyacetone phosphate acyltransferase